MILPETRDPRLVSVRRGGQLNEDDHRRLAVWAATCAQRVLHRFEAACPGDPRPRQAVDAALAWSRGELAMPRARAAAGAANTAARTLEGAPRWAAYAAAQAAVVAHVAEHALGAAAYALKAVQAAAPAEREAARRQELQWQRDQVPEDLKALVLEDQERRNAICWHQFDP